MDKNYTIMDLSRYVKVARELAILGNYEKSLSKYKTALNIIQSRLGEISDNYLKDKWKGTEDTLKNEVMLVYKAYEIAKRFENSEEERRRRQREEEEENNKILMRDYRPDKKKEDENGEYYIDEKGEKFYKRWAHFGGRPPFGYVNDPNDPNNVRHKPKKDPDVWDPPDDYKKPAKIGVYSVKEELKKYQNLQVIITNPVITNQVQITIVQEVKQTTIEEVTTTIIIIITTGKIPLIKITKTNHLNQVNKAQAKTEKKKKTHVKENLHFI